MQSHTHKYLTLKKMTTVRFALIFLLLAITSCARPFDLILRLSPKGFSPLGLSLKNLPANYTQIPFWDLTEPVISHHHFE